jgi:hypothetical protein
VQLQQFDNNYCTATSFPELKDIELNKIYNFLNLLPIRAEFNHTVSCSDHVASNDKTISEQLVESIWKEVLMA